MPILPDPTDGVAVRPHLLQGWTAALVGSVGTPDDIAVDVAEILVAADRRGIPSHGTARLPNYLALVSAGVMDPAARPVAEVERAALVRYDARNGWGHHACRVAMDRAIEMARTAGSALVVLRNSNHYGIAGLVRAACRGRRDDRDEPEQHLSTRRADARSRFDAGHEPDRGCRARRPLRGALPGHGDVDDPAGPDRGRRAPGRDPSRGLGDRRRRPACIDARSRARGCAHAARRRARRRRDTRATGSRSWSTC